MKNLILVLFILTFTALFCDDIRVFIDDGTVFEGELIDVESEVYLVRTGGILNKIPKTRITQIDDIEILHIYDYPNIKLLPISFIAFGTGYDFFCQYNDLRDLKITKDQNRKLALGIICTIAGIINTYIALDSVYIETKVNYIGLRWKF